MMVTNLLSIVLRKGMRRWRVLMVFTLFGLIIKTTINYAFHYSDLSSISMDVSNLPTDLLINMTNYKIPDFEPWDPTVTQYLKLPKIHICGTREPLTTTSSCIIQSRRRKRMTSQISDQPTETEGYRLLFIAEPPTLHLHKDRLPDYTASPSDKVSCCYRSIIREEMEIDDYNKDADNLYSLSDECFDVSNQRTIIHSTGPILVSCEDGTGEIYKNIHYLIGCQWINYKRSNKNIQLKTHERNSNPRTLNANEAEMNRKQTQNNDLFDRNAFFKKIQSPNHQGDHQRSNRDYESNLGIDDRNLTDNGADILNKRSSLFDNALGDLNSEVQLNDSPVVGYEITDVENDLNENLTYKENFMKTVYPMTYYLNENELTNGNLLAPFFQKEPLSNANFNNFIKENKDGNQNKNILIGESSRLARLETQNKNENTNYSQFSHKKNISKRDIIPNKNNIDNVMQASKTHNEQSFQNVYPNLEKMAVKRPKYQRKWSDKKSSVGKQKINVAIIGIDSVSRLSFRRYMPDAYAHLKQYGAIELNGQSKVGLNTYPNLLPILSGMSIGEIEKKIEIHNEPHDQLDIIWKNFSRRGYLTSYLEDDPKISTFNYKKLGFRHQPTDIYYRSMMLEAEEQIAHTKVDGDLICYGDQNIAHFVLDKFIDFAKTLWFRPWFGMYWINALTHGSLEYATTAERSVVNLIKSFYNEHYFKNTIMFFISDHGMRFGEYRENTLMGKFEDSLPFAYVLLPKWFRRAYPSAYKNLQINQHKLTTPYDLHLTLIDLLTNNIEKHQHDTKNLNDSNPSTGFQETLPNITKQRVPVSKKHSFSLFDHIPLTRSCKDAKIPNLFCMGKSFTKISNNNPIIKTAMDKIFIKINKDMLKFDKCIQFKNYRILNSMKIISASNDYSLKFQLFPSAAMFETSFSHDNNDVHITIISRVNKYGAQSYCIDDTFYRPYCFCKELL